MSAVLGRHPFFFIYGQLDVMLNDCDSLNWKFERR